MSIRKRLMLTNIGMIIIPIFGLLVVEIILGYFLLVVFGGDSNNINIELFMTLRFISTLIILIVTNGLLTYYVSKSILTPIQQLSYASTKISEGDLNYSITSNKKDELAKLTNTFESMRIKLKDAKAAQRQYEQNRQELIASISHDLKTPLTSIQGYVTGLKDGVANTPEKVERYLDTIYNATTDMNEMIEELFLYSKLDLKKVPFHFDEVDLYHFLTDVIDEYNFHLNKDTITLSTTNEGSYWVKADRDKLKRAVTNIVQNSIKYMDKKEKYISIYLTSDANDITVEIKDNGSGIRKEDLPYLFESFYRTDTSRNSSTGGSGLGLSIARKIIEEHGGSVWANSELRKGTSIYFNLKKVT